MHDGGRVHHRACDRTGGTALPVEGRRHQVIAVPPTPYYPVALFAAAAAHPVRPHHDRAGELEHVYVWVGLRYFDGVDLIKRAAEHDPGVPMCGPQCVVECAVSFDEKKVTVGRRAQAALVDLHREEAAHHQRGELGLELGNLTAIGGHAALGRRKPYARARVREIHLDVVHEVAVADIELLAALLHGYGKGVVRGVRGGSEGVCMPSSRVNVAAAGPPLPPWGFGFFF